MLRDDRGRRCHGCCRLKQRAAAHTMTGNRRRSPSEFEGLRFTFERFFGSACARKIAMHVRNRRFFREKRSMKGRGSQCLVLLCHVFDDFVAQRGLESRFAGRHQTSKAFTGRIIGKNRRFRTSQATFRARGRFESDFRRRIIKYLYSARFDCAGVDGLASANLRDIVVKCTRAAISFKRANAARAGCRTRRCVRWLEVVLACFFAPAPRCRLHACLCSKVHSRCAILDIIL